jgi:hypothetical protein
MRAVVGAVKAAPGRCGRGAVEDNESVLEDFGDGGAEAGQERLGGPST